MFNVGGIMPRVIHFEIGAENTERAVRFYKTVFGWEIKRWEGPQEYHLISTLPKDKPGIDGAIFKKPGPADIINTIDVPNIDEFIERIRKNGGELLGQKHEIQNVGEFAYCKDTEGNVFGIMQAESPQK
jgi:predicted enzyme related to lactoylglutathione lyase